jgi:hypothetical protein
VHASGLPPCAAITKVGFLLAPSLARSVASIMVGVHYLGSGELEGWQPWTARVMLVREVLSIAAMVLETFDDPACILSRHLGTEVLAGPCSLIGGSGLDCVRYISFWGTMWCFDVVVVLWWFLDWVTATTALGFLGGLATGPQPAWLTVSHVVTSGRSALCSLALLVVGLHAMHQD